MPTARKDVADYLNDNAMKAAKFIVESIDYPADAPPHQNQINAARIILDKVIPNLKAVDLSGDLGVNVTTTVEFK
jgi:hypothetical protein